MSMIGLSSCDNNSLGIQKVKGGKRDLISTWILFNLVPRVSPLHVPVKRRDPGNEVGILLWTFEL